jgi:hypothetical protein
VTDERPHRDDTFSSNGEHEYDGAKYPLRNFTTGAEYPEGLPAAMLEEMDRDVLTPEEYQRQMAALSAEEASRPPRRAMGKRPGRPGMKNQLAYGGKSFDEWRKVLLGDLEPETRVKALTALGAFGANGYGEEVAAAIAELLKNEAPSQVFSEALQKAASDALVRCGSAGVSVLQGQLTSDLVQSRRDAAVALAGVAPSTEGIAAALLKAVQDRDGQVRSTACRALARRHLNDPAVADALAQAAQVDQNSRNAIVAGLSQSNASAESVVKLVTRCLEDDDYGGKAAALAIFAARAPNTPENVEMLRSAVLDGGSQARKVFVEKLREQQQSREISPELTVPVLLALLESRESYQDLRGYQVPFVQMVVGMIDKMPRDNAATQTAIPVLIKAVDLELPDHDAAVSFGFASIRRLRKEQEADDPARRAIAQPAVVLAAAESLGRFGPAAKDALPSLKTLLEPGRVDHHQLQLVNLETEKQWQTRIQAIISRIEGK